MKTVFTKEELNVQLASLKEKRISVYNKRKGLLEKYSKKQSPANSDGQMHDLDRKIEDIERKLSILF